MKILFLTPYPPNEAPSQRFRFEQYYSILGQSGFSYISKSFLTQHNWQAFYQSGQVLTKVMAILTGFLRRFAILTSASRFDFVFIHREATPIGPPIIEWILAKVLKKRIVYDFDDAIWLTDKSTESAIFRFIKYRKKVSLICKWSYKVSCGNDYLATYARSFCSNVLINPTTIDTENVHNPDLFLSDNNAPKKKELIIGWTGSHSTLKYLKSLEKTIEKIELTYTNVSFLVIADKKPSIRLPRIRFKAWSAATEISDLRLIDIGIMPLPADEWAKGKCGFKALQYMSMCIPTIASPVGVNSTIVHEGVTGFLACTEAEWESAIIKLLKDSALRKVLGVTAREHVQKHFSVVSNKNLFLSLFS